MHTQKQSTVHMTSTWLSMNNYNRSIPWTAEWCNRLCYLIRYSFNNCVFYTRIILLLNNCQETSTKMRAWSTWQPFIESSYDVRIKLSNFWWMLVQIQALVHCIKRYAASKKINMHFAFVQISAWIAQWCTITTVSNIVGLCIKSELLLFQFTQVGVALFTFMFINVKKLIV